MPKPTPNKKTSSGKRTRKPRTVYITHLKNVIKQLSYTNKYHTVTEDGEKKMTVLILREAVANSLSDRIDFLIDALVPLATVFASNSDPSEETATTTTTTLLPEHVALAAAKIGIPAMILEGGPVEVTEKPAPKPKRVKKLDKKTAEKRRISEKITRKEEEREVAAAAAAAAVDTEVKANDGNESDSSSSSSSSASLSPMERERKKVRACPFLFSES